MAQNKQIGFLGSPGSYSHQAASIMRPNSTAVGYGSFEKLVAATEQGEVQEAVLPLENSTSGRIPDIHRLVVSMDLFIVEELLLDIHHCLIAAQPTDTDGIETLLSHQQGFIQSEKFLTEKLPNASHQQVSDTATAVKEAVESGDRATAAIGSEFAAKFYGGLVLNRNISDRDDNITRFALISRNVQVDEKNNMTSMILQVDHTPGSLVRALSVFGTYDVNITKLETYMISDTTVLPTFYLDLGSGSHDENLVLALKDLQSCITYSKFLGSYVADKRRSGKNGFLKP